MADLMIEIEPGKEISYVQASELSRRIEELGNGPEVHWHFNDCGCCVTVHGSDCTYLIGRDGGSTRFEGRGCQC